MEKTKRNPALKVIGAILIVAGVITFIVSAVQLYDVQTTTTHWAEALCRTISKNKCDKLDSVLHIYGSCGCNGYCRHCYGVHKAEKQCYGFSEYASCI